MTGGDDNVRTLPSPFPINRFSPCPFFLIGVSNRIVLLSVAVLIIALQNHT